MKQFIVELVSNASLNLYPDNTLASFSNFLPEQFNLDGDWEVALLEISYPALYHNITDGRFRYRENANEDGSCVCRIPAGLYHSLTDILRAMQDAVKTVNPHRSVNFTWNVVSRNQSLTINLPNSSSILNIIGSDLAHILGFPSSFLLFGEGPHESMYPIDILRYHSVMVYADIIEHGIIGDTRAPVLRCFPFTPSLKHDRILTTHYMNYQSFDKLQFKKIEKKNFHTITIKLRDHTGEIIPFVSVGITRLALLFRSHSNF